MLFTHQHGLYVKCNNIIKFIAHSNSIANNKSHKCTCPTFIRLCRHRQVKFIRGYIIIRKYLEFDNLAIHLHVSIHYYD